MLREFLQELEKENKIESIKEEFDTKSNEISIKMKKFEGKGIIFENIKGYENCKLLANICSSRDLIARALQTSRERVLFRMIEAMKKPLSYKIVEKADFLENEIKKPNIIEHIPLLTFFGEDRPFYTSSTIVCAKTKDEKVMNYSFHRLMYLGGNKFAIRVIPGRHLDRIMDTWNKEVPVAIFCSVHPAVELACATSLEFGKNELELANALLDGKLTCHDLEGFHIPSHAEIVMIGKIKKNELVEEGPFADLTETWDIIRKQPVLEVEKLYYRNEFIYRTILPAGAEHKFLMGLPQEPRIYSIVSNTLPRVKNVCLTQGGCCWLHAVVSIEKKKEGEGKNVGLAALAAHPSLKRVVVVDDDIDIFDEKQVEWAIATRVQASKDVIIIPSSKGSSLDPSQKEDGTTDKWIIDATKPVKEKEKFERIKFGGESEI